MPPVEIKGVAVDPADVTNVRAGNALWPGLSAFTGVTFFVYLLVKLLNGQAALTPSLAAQIGVAGCLAGAGLWLLARGRYFYLVIDTAEGARKIGGLTKDERDRARERLSAG